MRGGAILPLTNTASSKEEMITEPYKGKELPEWFDWQNKADTLELLYLRHQRHEVRKRSYAFSLKINDVGGGSTYIRRESFAFANGVAGGAGMTGRAEDALCGNKIGKKVIIIILETQSISGVMVMIKLLTATLENALGIRIQMVLIVYGN